MLSLKKEKAISYVSLTNYHPILTKNFDNDADELVRRVKNGFANISL